ncbi:MAG: 1-deoxy-D-xylulose-5-phosphate reductoisomerase [bacterium]|nr:1-deoxy-D-xylulose-5-phosphate reductoisomerase [bacterium]
MKKKVIILGSTGSIGKNALKIIEHLKDDIEIVAIAANNSIDDLISQVSQFRPKAACIFDEKHHDVLSSNVNSKCRVFSGRNGLRELVREHEADIVVNSIVGAAGLLPTLDSIDTGKSVALANKESLVVAGELVMAEAEKKNVEIFPVDSEHSAIWQCMLGEERSSIKNIILTASGGPFLDREVETFEKITVEEALDHPNWDMGKKITIDSATLMNKGFEYIETHWLFGVPGEQIRIMIHPQSIVHSMVEFEDGSIKAQIGIPDMRVPIQFALTYPERKPGTVDNTSLFKGMQLSFKEPDLDRYPCLRLSIEALEVSGTVPAVLNAANEMAVNSFLDYEIKFTDIPEIIEKIINKHNVIRNPVLEDYLEVDRWARDVYKNEVVKYG